MNPLKTFPLSNLSLLIAVTISLGACAPVFAPPVRSTHYGAPGKLKSGQVEVGGGANLHGTGGPQLAYALSDSMQLELGSDMSFTNDGEWLMGYGGIRYTSISQQRGKLRWVMDLELGGGAGLGGANECANKDSASVSNCLSDGLVWQDWFAYGGYVGLGLGLHVDWFSTFLRARAQATDATGVPATFWLSSVLGVGVDLSTWFHLYVAGGVAAYSNEMDSDGSGLAEAGLSLTF